MQAKTKTKFLKTFLSLSFDFFVLSTRNIHYSYKHNKYEMYYRHSGNNFTTDNNRNEKKMQYVLSSIYC